VSVKGTVLMPASAPDPAREVHRVQKRLFDLLAHWLGYWLRVLSNRRNWLKATAGMGFARIARIG
jgi:hypothetical protein